MVNELFRNGDGYVDQTAYKALSKIQEEERVSKMKYQNMDIRRGDIFYIYKQEYTGSEQESGRPAIIVSNDIGNSHAPIVSIVYLTTQEKNNQPTHTKVFCNNKESTALCEQVATISKNKIGSYITSCTESEMENVDAALACALGLDFAYAEDENVQKMEDHEKDNLRCKIKELQDEAVKLKEHLKRKTDECTSLFEEKERINDAATDVIDFIERKKLGFLLGSAVQYIAGADKNKPDHYREDLGKAKWYIEKEIERNAN